MQGQVVGLGRIVGGQQARAQVGAADAAAGVDPRSQQEAGVERRGRPLALGHLGQGLQPWIGPGRHHLQPLGGQGAVEADQGGHVADRAQGRQVQPAAQVRLGAGGEQAAPARLAIERGQQHEGDPGGGQHALAGIAARPVGIDHGRRRGRLLAHQVMVDHHHLQPHLGRRGDRLIGGGAAVDGDHQFGALVAKAAEGGRAGAVALGQPVGDIDRQVAAQGAEPAHQLGGAGGAVHVIVGEHRRGPVLLDCIDDQHRGAVHVHEAGGVGELGLERGRQIVLGHVLAHAARGQGAGQGLAQAMAQGVAAGQACVGRPLAPAAAAQRAVDPQEGQAGDRLIQGPARVSSAPRARCGSRRSSPASGYAIVRPHSAPRPAARPG